MIKRVYSKRQKRFVWMINVTCDGRRIRTSGFATQKEASDAIAALRLRQRSVRLGLTVETPQVTLKQLLTARKDDKHANSTRTRERLVGYFEVFVTATGPETPVRSVGLSHLRAFRDSLGKLRPSTLKYKMAGVISSLNSAGMYFPELEDYRTPRLTMPQVKGRSTLVPRAEFQSVLTMLRTLNRPNYAKAADVLELLALTGARVGEILSLTPSQIDWDRELLTLSSKTKMVRLIPIVPRTRQLLTNWVPLEFGYHSLKKYAKAAAKHAGCSIHRDHWTIHDIRRTAASLLAEAGTSHSIIAALLGHTLSGATAVYTHATIPALRLAALILERSCTDSVAHHLKAV